MQIEMLLSRYLNKKQNERMEDIIMENEKITNCNQCPNQCPVEALQCGRGRHYFEQMGKPDDLYGLMRACGHYLHHSSGNPQREEGRQQLFAALDEAEQETLKGLLKKLTESWER